MNNKNKFNEEWWNKNPMTYKDWNLSENVRSSIDIDELKKINSELEKHEKINKIILLKDNWTIENNILTPTMKIKRNIIEKKYKENYDKWVKDKNEIIFQ